MICPACRTRSPLGTRHDCELEANRAELASNRDRLLAGFGEVPRVYSGGAPAPTANETFDGVAKPRLEGLFPRPLLRHVSGEGDECVSWCEACRVEEGRRASKSTSIPKGVFAGVGELLDSLPAKTPEELAELERAAQLDLAAAKIAELRADGRPIRVLVESPFAGDDESELARNRIYLAAALRDCFDRGEAPFASHGLYTLDGVLDDTIPEERKKGIEEGLEWGRLALVTVVYSDLGTSRGMKQGIERAHAEGRPVVYRTLPAWSRRLAR